MNILSLTVENVYWFSQVSSLILLGGTVILGGVALFTGKVINDRAARQLEEVRSSNIAAQSALEKERTTRLELEKSLAPREAAFVSALGKSNADMLKPFAGMQAIISFVSDAEASRAASFLEPPLRMTGWQVVTNGVEPLNAGMYFDGVKVEAYEASEWPTDDDRAAELRSREAAKAFISFLTESGWAEIKYGWQRRDIPTNSIKITVGLKPSPYFKFKPDWLQLMQQPDKPQ